MIHIVKAEDLFDDNQLERHMIDQLHIILNKVFPMYSDKKFIVDHYHDSFGNVVFECQYVLYSNTVQDEADAVIEGFSKIRDDCLSKLNSAVSQTIDVALLGSTMATMDIINLDKLRVVLNTKPSTFEVIASIWMTVNIHITSE
jgi:hypothetical protein